MGTKYKEETKGERKSLNGAIHNLWCGVTVGRLVVVFVILLIISHNMGRSGALTKTNFLLLAEEKPTVVLRVYGDRIICASFNRDTKQLDESLTIRNMTDLRFTIEEVGPLILPQNQNCK